MKSCLTKSRTLILTFDTTTEKLTLLPLTFGKLVDISSALGDEKDLSSVLSNPNPFDLSLVTYCLLDDKSKERLDSYEIEINSDIHKEIDGAHKLYYLLCENNVAYGLLNYTNVIETVAKLVQESTSQGKNKKKFFK